MPRKEDIFIVVPNTSVIEPRSLKLQGHLAEIISHLDETEFQKPYKSGLIVMDYKKAQGIGDLDNATTLTELYLKGVQPAYGFNNKEVSELAAHWARGDFEYNAIQNRVLITGQYLRYFYRELRSLTNYRLSQAYTKVVNYDVATRNDNFEWKPSKELVRLNELGVKHFYNIPVVDTEQTLEKISSYVGLYFDQDNRKYKPSDLRGIVTENTTRTVEVGELVMGRRLDVAKWSKEVLDRG
jgi:hypothetical protein